jgi:hypothetical protein
LLHHEGSLFLLRLFLFRFGRLHETLGVHAERSGAAGTVVGHVDLSTYDLRPEDLHACHPRVQGPKILASPEGL